MTVATDSLIESVKEKDPKLYDILKGLSFTIDALDLQLNPPAAKSNKIISNPTIVPNDVTNFSYVITPLNVIFSWSATTDASTYEVRQGAVWETANFVTQVNSLQLVINSILVGNSTYLIKAIGDNGQYSAHADSVVVTIPIILGPVVTGMNVTNNALLTWIPPISVFQIAYYVITRNSVQIGTVLGTFFTYAESSAATINYGVRAVDIAGNIGIETIASVTVTAPTDFVLQSIITSVFSGTKTNCYKDEFLNALIACVNTTETYEQHFVNNGYTTPKSQVDAGFPIYIEPGKATGSYEEVFDFGLIVNNVVVGITYLTQLVAGSVGLASTLKFSTDNVTYTAGVAGPSAFASTVRYVKVKLDFTGGTAALLALSNFQCSIAVHREMDGGSGTANSGDAGGTVFSFNKPFVSVESVTATPRSTNSYKAVITSVTTTTFKVLVFDDAGVRQTVTVDWKGRGII